jgi:hypothetical protein
VRSTDKEPKLVRCRRPLILASIVVVAAFSLLAAGCGSRGVARIASSTTAARTTQSGALAFARCMRSHGIPNWPDPTSSGVFDKSKLRQLGLSVSRVLALEDGPCNHLYTAPPPPGTRITPAERVYYLKVAACMRSHGFLALPDPTFQDNILRINIPPSIDTNSFQFKSAAATCTKLIPAGLPGSRSNGH